MPVPFSTVGRKKKPLPLRVKRMNRERRITAARSWLLSYTGKNILRGYCKHFGVDWRCAAAEVEILGVKVDAGYLATPEATEAELVRKRAGRKQEREAQETDHWHPYTDPFSAYLAGDFAALHDLEQGQTDAGDAAVDSPRDPPF